MAIWILFFDAERVNAWGFHMAVKEVTRMEFFRFCSTSVKQPPHPICCPASSFISGDYVSGSTTLFAAAHIRVCCGEKAMQVCSALCSLFTLALWKNCSPHLLLFKIPIFRRVLVPCSDVGGHSIPWRRIAVMPQVTHNSTWLDTALWDANLSIALRRCKH